MPAKLQAVPGTNTIYATFQASPFDDERPSALTDLKYDAKKRGPLARASYGWSHSYGWWPCRSGFSGDPASPAALMLDQGLVGNGGAYSPWLAAESGCQHLKFIMGRCVDSDGNGVSGAVVQGFVTATDTLERETTADSNGYYELGTQYASPAQHYLVAYRGGSPDIAGTTVNTLTATNRDGT